MSADTRRILSFLALAIAAGLLFVADGLRYFDRNLLDSSAFADRATEALEKEAVRARLAQEIASQVERRVPATSGQGAVLEAAAYQMIETTEFERIFRAAVREIHGFAFDDRETQLLMDLSDVGAPLRQAATDLDPGLASQIPPGFDARVAEVSDEVDRTLGDIREFSERAGGLADITLLLGLALVAASLILAINRFGALIRVGWMMVAIGLIYLVTYYVARGIVASDLENSVGTDAAKGAWDGLLGGLRNWNLGLLIAGLLVVVGTVLVRKQFEDRDIQGWDEAPTQRW